jgi:restriction endonuclease S subunit
MAVWSHATLSSVTNFDRFDGEYFLPIYIKNSNTLSRIETVPLPAIFYVSDGNHLSVSKYFSEDGNIPYFRGQDINDFFLENATPIRIPERIFSSPMMDRSHFQPGDVLLSIVGTIGSLSIVPESFGSATGSCKIAILRSKGTYSPFVLAAFLVSRYGQLQIRRNTRGAVQMGLILKDLVRIHVPIFSDSEEQKIESFVKRAIEANRESKFSYDQAKQLLESELGLDKLHFDKPVGYTAQFSELELSRRFDSEHYYPAFDNLKNKLPKHIQLVPLSSVLTCCQRGKQPIYSASGLPVLNSKHILENKITLEGNRYAKPTFVTGLQIQYGDVLINGTGRGTIGRTAPYLVSEHQAIPDNHVTILRSSTLDPAYLSFYLNSLAGKLQVEKYQRGSSGQLELYPFDIRKFQVWEAPQPIQQEIRRLYDQATESARQSKQLLDRAKSRVEQLIEEAVQL